MACVVVLRCDCGELVTSFPLASSEYVKNPKYGGLYIDFRPCSGCGSILSTTSGFLNSTKKKYVVVQQLSRDSKKVIGEIECI